MPCKGERWTTRDSWEALVRARDRNGKGQIANLSPSESTAGADEPGDHARVAVEKVAALMHSISRPTGAKGSSVLGPMPTSEVKLEEGGQYVLHWTQALLSPLLCWNSCCKCWPRRGPKASHQDDGRKR